MLLISTALSCEAKPLIKHFSLKRKLNPICPLYYGDNIVLVVTGVGLKHVKECLAYAYGVANSPKNPSILNIGTAAAKSLAVGEVVIGSKISSDHSDLSYYPHILKAFHGKYHEIMTVLEVVKTPLTNTVYEMEAHGFFELCSLWTSLELIHVIKVISDQGWEHDTYPDKSFVSNLIKKQIPFIESFLEELKKIQSLLPVEKEIPLDKFSHLHFTESENAKLKHLLKAYRALQKEDLPFFSSKEILFSYLEKTPHL